MLIFAESQIRKRVKMQNTTIDEIKKYIDDTLIHCEEYHHPSRELHFFNVGYKMCLEKIKSFIDKDLKENN